MNKKAVVLIVTTLLLAACGTVPQRKAATLGSTTSGGGYLPGDGPGKDIPVNLDAIPDAVPKVEPLHPYANRPYIALGKTYTPMTVVGNFRERGMASWYGKKFNGQRTSSGEIYDMYAMTAAHPTLPLPSYARVTNLANHKSVIVRINDRGPFMKDRIIDLSYTAAYKLGIIGDGSDEVEVDSIDPNVTVNSIAASTVQSQPLDSKPVNLAPVAAPAAAASAVVAAPVAAAGSTAAIPVAAPVTANTPPAAIDSLASSDTAVYLQLGAFKTQDAAEAYLEKMRNELGDNGKQLKLSTKDGLVRVHIGPYASQSEARSSADSMEDKLGFKPMVNLP
jgi:rare lipoprotein A